MRLFKITNYGFDKAAIRWVLCTNSFSSCKIFNYLSDLNEHKLVPGRIPWEEWLAKITILSDCKASTISGLLAQIPEELI